MSNDFLSFTKSDEIPTLPCEPNTMYLVSLPPPIGFKIYVSNKTGTAIKDLTDSSYIETIVSNMLMAGNSAIDWQGIPLLSDSTYVWNAIYQKVMTHDESHAPILGTVKGNMKGLLFSGTVLNESWVEFTLPNDVHLDSNLYLGVHWMPISTSTGNVKIGLEYEIVKGFAQQSLSSTTTVYVEQNITTSQQYKGHTSLVADDDAIDDTAVEPGAIVRVRVFRDPTDSGDTFNDSIHLWQLSLHYQKARIGTRNKSPNFFI